MLVRSGRVKNQKKLRRRWLAHWVRRASHSGWTRAALFNPYHLLTFVCMCRPDLLLER